MPAHRLLSQSQVEVLLSYMDQHRDLASSALSKQQMPESKRKVKRLWEELASLINNVDDARTKKSGDAWRTYWGERKYSVRKKAMKIQHSLSTGKPGRLQLNDEELKILDVMGKQVLKTMPPGMESFQDEDSSQSSAPDPLSKPDKLQSHKTPQKQSTLKTEISHHPRYANVGETGYEAHHSSDGPPQWAIDIEERRACAAERAAASLERLTTAVVGMHESLRTLSGEVAAIREVLVSRPS